MDAPTDSLFHRSFCHFSSCWPAAWLCSLLKIHAHQKMLHVTGFTIEMDLLDSSWVESHQAEVLGELSL